LYDQSRLFDALFIRALGPLYRWANDQRQCAATLFAEEINVSARSCRRQSNSMSCFPAECGEGSRVLVMFGSQTGVAESIAQRIFDHLCNAGLPAELMECNKYKKSSSPGGNGFFGERKVIIICSTTGNGDAPDNCDRFWRYLKRRSHGPDVLNGMKFTILGLGDTNYDKFCYMGTALDKRLVELGAERFYDLGCADEAMGLDTVVEPWLKGLYGHFDGLTPPVSLPGIGTIMMRNEGVGASKIDQDLEAASTIDPISRVPSLGNLCLLDHEHEDDSFAPASPLSPNKSSLFSLQNPCVGEVKGAKYLTKGGPHSRKRVIHLDIGIPMIQDSSGGRGSFAEVPALTYTPGDAIGIICPNKSSTVERLLVRLKLQEVADSFYTISTPTHRDNPSDAKHDQRYVRKAMAIPMAHRTPRLVMTHHLDLTSTIRKVTLKKLSKFCQSVAEMEHMSYLSSREGKLEYDKNVEARRSGLEDILKMFPSCMPPFDVVISLLPALMPRFYSVASSPIKTPNTISIAFTVVEYSVPSLTDETHQIPRHGLCTTWLEEICKPFLLHQNIVEGYHQPLEFFIREAKEFVLPANPRWPLIFVGPGTGVAPFIGFLSHREALARQTAVEKDDVCSGYWRMGFELDGLEDDEIAADNGAIDDHGPIHLFFGCQHKSKDFIYEDEILSFERTHLLTSLKTAFSRDQAEKVYVQHRLLENGQLVADLLLKENGYFYICGDGAKMAMDVEDALLNILSLYGENVTKDSALSILKELKERQRYVKDVWS
jgi:methionine synthase reductase